MPTIEVSHADLNNLVGRKLSLKQLEEDMLYTKGEIDGVDGDILKIDIKDTNRPDLWSAEGVAREIRFRYKPTHSDYKTKKSGVVVHVDPKLKDIRPYTACAVVRGLNITENALLQSIQLQEKVAGTFGKNRKEIAIGIYDLHKIKSPIRYTVTSPTGMKFAPLEFSKELTPKQILDQHPKGKEFGHLLNGMSYYPVFIDDAKEILSMPPIINSNHTGKVTEETHDVFIECSGFNLELLKTALNVIVVALADRGGRIETVDVVYDSKKLTMPDLTPKRFTVSPKYINRLSGLNLKNEEIKKLLERSGYKVLNNTMDVLYPAYRQDIMHQADIAEDVMITYGFNKIKPEMASLVTRGSMTSIETFSKKATDIMIGTGLQEVMSYILTNRDNLFTRMNMKTELVAEIENPMSINWSVFRNSLLPGLMEFLSQNTHREFPQKIFEIGDVVELHPKTETRTNDVRRLAVALSDTAFGYQTATEMLDFMMSSLGIAYKLVRTEHPSMIPGRAAKVVVKNKEIGLIGEIHAQVLNNWKLELPVAAFEIDLTSIC